MAGSSRRNPLSDRAVESQPRTCGSKMTGDRAKIPIREDKSPVEVRRKTAEILDVRPINVSSGLSGTRIDRVGDQPY